MELSELLNSGVSLFGQAAMNSHQKKIKEMEFISESAKAYREVVGIQRFGDFCDLNEVNIIISQFIEKEGGKFTSKEAETICELMDRMPIVREQDIHPYELPIIYDFKILYGKLKTMCQPK